MDNAKEYAMKKKNESGKWWTWGSIKVNKFGSFQASFKNTPEFRKMIEESGDWINLSVFENQRDEVKKEAPKQAPALSDDIPFGVALAMSLVGLMAYGSNLIA
jgi:phage anti-repressor protein